MCVCVGVGGAGGGGGAGGITSKNHDYVVISQNTLYKGIPNNWGKIILRYHNFCYKI